jgi:transcriptional regulator GlxA family with amidase domain
VKLRAQQWHDPDIDHSCRRYSAGTLGAPDARPRRWRRHPGHRRTGSLIDPNKAPQGAYAAFSTQKSHGDAAILRAQELIESDVADRVGYADVVAFRKLFARHVGLTPFEYRGRYGPRAAPAWEPSDAAHSFD